MTALPSADTRPADVIVGEYVHLLLRRAGISQRTLAETLGLRQATISMKVHGRRPWTLEELQRSATLLNVSVADLVSLLPHLDSNQEPSD